MEYLELAAKTGRFVLCFLVLLCVFCVCFVGFNLRGSGRECEGELAAKMKTQDI